ncbi:hypothetical protein BEP19_01910 [Ammoniphilus oxalaticus]|uniref:Uncharacterized protein n=1 Tax=Ammoniphilus oxalaticus TaxID=66863 RepID=A0A419SNC9_9BACL|nr:hypothetical protein [Ammoniphilus oxalaticus]RKD25721.1 hypothetical protein BEP19_01910 [Ammoniphilus oxalaticus]
MRKKEFKLLLATNPVLQQWMKENHARLKTNPEILFYLTRHPEGMKHFRSDQPVDNQKIVRESQLFMKELMKEREERRGSRKRRSAVQSAASSVPSRKEKGGGPSASVTTGVAQPQARRGGGLLGNIKALFDKTVTPPPRSRPSSSQRPLPTLQRPGQPIQQHRQQPASRIGAVKGLAHQTKRSLSGGSPNLKIPKLKLSRKQVMSTLNQTTEMLDVVGALIGKVSHLK